MEIKVGIVNKYATAAGAPVIICDNSDYTVLFTFDDEWDGLEVKTARFVYVQDGAVKYQDIVFTGDTVAVPVLSNVREVQIGVFSGDLHTTSPAVVPCQPSIRCGTGAPADPTPDQYDQIMALLNEGGLEGPSAYEIAKAHGFEGTEEEWLASLHGKDGKDGENGQDGEGGQPGADGKSAYELAVLNGFEGTEAEWLESLKGADGAPNCHAEFFTITDDGETSLKPEYRGATSKSTYEASLSDMGAGVVGSLNVKLPKDLIIPEVVEETAVDRLSAGMFLDNTAVESLTFPVTVTEIPENFANGSVNLRHIKNTERIRSIAARAFVKCRLEKVVMPNLEQILEPGALGNNPHLIYADIGKVAEIPKQTFAYDLALSKVTAENVQSVGEQAFFDTPRLVNADFLGGLTSVGKAGLWRTGLTYDWSSLTKCTFGSCATSFQANPTDFWSGLTPTPCENPTPTALCQVDPRWNDRQIGTSGRYYGANGCGVFCALHTYCGLNNLTLTSVTEFEDIVNAVDPTLLNNYRGTLADITNILNGIGVNATFIDNAVATWNAEYLSELYDVLASGGYAIVTVGSPEGHAVVIHGVNEKKELLYLDCARKYYYDLSKPCRAKLPFEKLIAHNTDFILVTR